jgi:hypothetical protein
MSGSGPFINSRKRAPIVLGAGRASRSAAARGPAAAINPDAASPATWTNSRLFVLLAIIAPQKLRSFTLNRRSADDLVGQEYSDFLGLAEGDLEKLLWLRASLGLSSTGSKWEQSGIVDIAGGAKGDALKNQIEPASMPVSSGGAQDADPPRRRATR